MIEYLLILLTRYWWGIIKLIWSLSEFRGSVSVPCAFFCIVYFHFYLCFCFILLFIFFQFFPSAHFLPSFATPFSRDPSAHSEILPNHLFLLLVSFPLSSLFAKYTSMIKILAPRIHVEQIAKGMRTRKHANIPKTFSLHCFLRAWRSNTARRALAYSCVF